MALDGENLGSSSGSSSRPLALDGAGARVVIDDYGTEDVTRNEPDREQTEQLLRWSDHAKTPNIAKELEERGRLDDIGQRVLREYEVDLGSRLEWVEQAKKALDLARQVTEEKTTPWPKASNVIYPLIGTAAIQFSARAYPAIVAGPDVVKGVVVGSDKGTAVIDIRSGQPLVDQSGQVRWASPPGAKRKRADAIGEHMSWQLIEEQPEWEEETDKLITVLPIVGCEFRKTYFDSTEGRNVSVRVSAMDVVINYWAKSVETAPRITEVLKLYPIEIEEMERADLFLKHDYGVPDNAGDDKDAPHEFLEQHRRLDLDDDGYGEPYIVTVHKTTGKVARIVARFDAEGVKFSKLTHEIAKIEPVHYYTKFDFLRNPDGGIYGVGFGHYLAHMNESINTSLNMMFDAGTLQNTGGGFIGKGLSMHSGSVKFKIGEWKVVNALGSTVREAIVPLIHQGPSAVMFQLLGMLIAAGEKLASVNEILTGNQTNANVPATTTLALIEQGLKVFTAIYKRIHTSLKSEYDKLYRLNRLYLDEQTSYRRGDEWREISRKDYQQGAGVEPISDPTMVSDLQQLARAEFLKQFINDPLCDGMEIRRRIFTAAKVADIDTLLNQKPAPNPMLMVKAAELKVKMIGVKAKAIADMAGAVKALADADATMAGTYLQYITLQLDHIRDQIETLDDEQPQGTNGQGPAPGGLPGMEAPPGDAGLSGIPPELLGGAAPGSPGAMGAGAA